MANEDKDLSSIDAMPDPDVKPTAPAQGDALAEAIQTTAVGIGTDSGTAPEQVAAEAADAATATRNLAQTAVTVGEGIRILKRAAAAWKKNAPKKAEFDAADKELADARKQMGDAAEASGDTSAASKRVEAALAKLRQLQADRKAADDAFDREWKKAVAKLNSLQGGDKDQDGDSPGAPGKPSAPGTQSTGSGAPVAKPGSGTPAGTPAAKPTGSTPSAQTPSAEKPSSTTSGLTPAEAAALVTAAQGQQNQQGQQAQPQQATPTATTPQATQPQQDKDKKDSDPAKTLLEEAERNSPAILAAAGITNPTTSSPVTHPTTQTPVASANGNSTTLRGPDAKITGVNLGGTPAVNTQNPATSGNSQTGLTTTSDVAGRPQGTENKPFGPTPAGAETKTSGASSGNTAQQQAATQQAGQRGGGMPAMPFIPPSGGSPAAGGGGGRHGDDERERGVASTSDPLGLMHERGHAVDGGTIAQNKPDRDNPAAA